MTRPDHKFIKWATDANQSSGDYSGNPTKVDIGDAAIAQGLIAGSVGRPEGINFYLNLLSKWAEYRGLQVDRNLVGITPGVVADNWQDMAYGEDADGVGIWVTVGDDNSNNDQIYRTIFGTFDASYMEDVSPSVAAPARCVAWANGTWWLGRDSSVGSSNIAIASSTDGDSWVGNTTVDNTRLNAAVGDGTNVVLVGRDTNLNLAVFYQRPGSGYTGIATADEMLDVAYGNSIFVAVGIDSSGTGPAIFTSPTGAAATWTSRTSAGTEILRGVCWNGTTFVAYGDNGEIITSTDGITWALQSSPATGAATDTNKRIAADPDSGLVLWYDEDDRMIMSSIDGGVNWSDFLEGAPTQLSSIRFGGGRFLFTETNQGRVFLSR